MIAEFDTRPERATPAAPVSAQRTSPPPAGESSAVGSNAAAANQPAGAWSRVSDPSQVCMVNNQFMGCPQIPIAVEGKTYYGCWEMCKGRLGKDPKTRTATDPLTHKPVDKAVAVIAKRADGAVAYFESEQNFAEYARQN